jgi:hypothetical protein
MLLVGERLRRRESETEDRPRAQEASIECDVCRWDCQAAGTTLGSDLLLRLRYSSSGFIVLPDTHAHHSLMTAVHPKRNTQSASQAASFSPQTSLRMMCITSYNGSFCLSLKFSESGQVSLVKPLIQSLPYSNPAFPNRPTAVHAHRRSLVQTLTWAEP